jgi:putative transposon-encoded protein
MDITLRGYEVLERTVKIVGNSGGVGVPKAWLGKRVKVVLLEE